MSKLFIIAGHGAGDSGAVGNGYTEAERVRALASKIAVLGGPNVTVGDMSRNWYRDNGISRLNVSNDYQILELHMDSSPNPSARGGHVIIKSGFAPDDYDNALATMIGCIFPGRSKLIVGRSDLANVNRAATKGYGYRLMECGFISNAGDIQTFNSRMDEIAKGILNAFCIEGVSGAEPKPIEKPDANQNINKIPVNVTNSPVNFTYAVKIEGGRVLPAVTNLSDYAGIRGKRITDIAIKCDKGSLWYQVHVLGGGWLPKVTGYNWNDHNNGYAGNGKVIDAVRVYYNTPQDIARSSGYQKAQYHVSPVNGNYYSWQYDNETGNGQDGYAGCFGKAIDRFQLC
ncbi:MAG: N-acetylmuramoyl-L-alanine amidase [Dorea sp.]|jgi:hypothetical protein|nr:N-acetylmuramoyl-L-alanine amidase [Dorea sp.]